MIEDKDSLVSFFISIFFHLILIFLFSNIIFKSNIKRVALITDVTLIDINKYMGEKGQEKEKVIGLNTRQKRIGETIKKKKKLKKTVDIKKLLKKIEKEKEKLSLGISKEKLRTLDEDSSIIHEDTDTIEDKELVAGSEPVITGPLAYRKYKKVKWKFPKKLPEETELAIEITVLPSGVIKNVKLIRTSGYPELDRIAISQARKLQFTPLPSSAKQEVQVGVLLFKFGVKK